MAAMRSRAALSLEGPRSFAYEAPVIRRTILEWESIAMGEDEGIPRAAADRIAAVAAASPLAGRGGGGF